ILRLRMPFQIAVLQEVGPVAFTQRHAGWETGSLQRLLMTRQPCPPRALLGILMTFGRSKAHTRIIPEYIDRAAVPRRTELKGIELNDRSSFSQIIAASHLISPVGQPQILAQVA